MTDRTAVVEPSHPFFGCDLRQALQAHAVMYLCPRCTELETSGLTIRDVNVGCQDYGQGRDVSLIGYMPLFKAAFELRSVMGCELRLWIWGSCVKGGWKGLREPGAQWDQLRHEPQGQGGERAGSQGEEDANCLVVRNSCGSTGEKGIDGNWKLTLKSSRKKIDKTWGQLQGRKLL